MSAILPGNLLVFPDCEEEEGFGSAVVTEVTADRVLARSAAGEKFDLSRSDLESFGVAANGSAYDPIYTVDAFRLRLEGERVEALQELASVCGWGTN